MLTSYPKIWHLGHPDIQDIFQDAVTIEEKIDGSQFSACWTGTDLECRSKGAEIIPDGVVQALFKPAVETFKALSSSLTPGWVYRGEAVCSPRHNALTYERRPTGGFILFDVMTGPETYMSYEDKCAEAKRLGLEVVPVLFKGNVSNVDELKELLKTKSILGLADIEGFVVKNYNKFTRDGKPMFGKYVSEQFKETHQKAWKVSNPDNNDIMDILEKAFCSEARWTKAIQHLRDSGSITDSPKDIGPLLKEVLQDAKIEVETEMKEILFKWAWARFSSRLTKGFPDWYKKRLMNAAFNNNEGEDSNG